MPRSVLRCVCCGGGSSNKNPVVMWTVLALVILTSSAVRGLDAKRHEGATLSRGRGMRDPTTSAPKVHGVPTGVNQCHSSSAGVGREDVALWCNLRVLDSTFSVANRTAEDGDGGGGGVGGGVGSGFSLDAVTRLTLACNEVYYFQSVLPPSLLQPLPRLRSFSIEHCKMSGFEDTAFSSLRNLRNLSIRTWNSDWPVMTLSLQGELFKPLEELEWLDLSTNNIWELPSDTLCHLPSLKALNLSHNHLQDVTQLGFQGNSEDGSSGGGGGGDGDGAVVVSDDDSRGDSVVIADGGGVGGRGGGPKGPQGSKSCISDVTSLDLSHNDVTILVSGALRGLGRLRELLLNHNELVKVDDHAVEGLGSLQTLDLSHNKLVALPEDAFKPTPGLMYFRARNNSLAVVAPGLFRGLDQMVELDLSHNELSSSWLSETVFQGLIRLMLLDLSHNKIAHLHQHVFQDLYSVQVLRLAHNVLEEVPAGVFAACVNLHTLDLSFNRLAVITDGAFQGLNVLSFLALDNNQISEISPKAFTNLTSLKDLNVNGNKLTAVPESLVHLRYLATLDLGENLITSLQDMSVNGLQFLYGLRIVNNPISGNITRDTFLDMPSLKILNLAKNEITNIEPGAFETNKNLQAVRLDANKLTSMNGLFEQLPNLLWLNVSDNNIEDFDYHFIPSSLQWLDLHKNQITDLSNIAERHDIHVQTLDASFNQISYISNVEIPDSVQLLFLNDNKISMVEPFTFFKKVNLTRVDLFANQLTNMDMSALRLSPVPDDQSLPEFYLGGNPFVCDCTMEWLQRVNQLEHLRHHPTIMDLESIYCKMPFTRTATFIPLVEVDPEQFLCKYETHCFALCHCCEFDACDCEMTCPEGCSCYHDQSWRSNIVECSRLEVDEVPDRIPMDATEVYLDGNVLKNLTSHAFIGRKHLQVLYVNGSSVETLDNGTFSGLTRLTALHLEDNLLSALNGHEFTRMEHLRELYLHGNRLRYIDQHTFSSLPQLEILTLHNNLLVNFPAWRLVDNSYLVHVSLRDNHWSCQCQFVESFGIWLSRNEVRVADGREVKCSSNVTGKPGPFIVDYNSTTCLNLTVTSTIVQPIIMDDLLHPFIATCAAFILVVLFIVCFLYRNTIRVWVYSHCGVRICYKSTMSEDRDKLFDAFVSYSSKDEAWVTQVLAAELEQGEKPYRVCLHYRDFPVTAYIADTIVEAVESSRRTIIILSKNFIENEWCRFQFKSAHHEVLKNRKKRLIVIVLGEIPARDLDPDLRLYLKTNTCIHTSDKLFWEKLKFAMPDSQNNQRVVHTYSTIPERRTVNKYSSPPMVRRSLHSSDAYWA